LCVAGNYIEFGEFKSWTARGTKQWASSVLSGSVDGHTQDCCPSARSTSSDRAVLIGGQNQMASDRQLIVHCSRAPSMTTTTVRSTAEQRRLQKEATAERALHLAKTNVSNAMDLIREVLPMEFMAHSSW